LRRSPLAPPRRIPGVSQSDVTPIEGGQNAIGIFLILVTLRSQGPVVLNVRLRLQVVDNSDKLVRHEVDGCPTRADYFIVFPKPPYGILH
jgi:hypothetical protein